MFRAIRVLSFLFLTSAPLLFAPADLRAHILDLDRGEYVTFEQMIGDLEDARVIFIGELHDRLAHHRAQLQVIRTLHQSGQPVAIGLEMVRQKSQDDLDRWVAGEMSERQFRRVFEENWGMWPLYEEILKYARKERIPLVALNIDREITRQVAQNGFDSLHPEQIEELPGVRCDIDDTYRQYIRRTLGVHAHDGASFENFCEAQMVWDTTMAQNLLAYLQQNPQRQVVVLAGSGHAWKHGIPEQLRRREEQIGYRVLLPEIEGRVGPADASPDEADYLLLGTEEGPLH